ncbi:DsbA family protein [Longitalea arenae]|uniref:DsbA family protein n=1 Tax=Longitalea arenae TaxID=2812558 RepID=UPI00196783B3|nr:thioredoxin domain-containing protein [Longitalea arenae]
MLKPFFNINHDHFSGATTAKIELVQFGDFQSRNCFEAYHIIKFLQFKMGNNLKFVFRHFPRITRHPLSMETAIAAEAAARQNKFWHMHDLLFANYGNITRQALTQFAKEIEIDPLLYELHREDKKVFRKIISDFESGIKSGVTDCPTFFINGLRYNGPIEVGQLYKTCRLLCT